jgi:hypothetical protein
MRVILAAAFALALIESSAQVPINEMLRIRKILDKDSENLRNVKRQAQETFIQYFLNGKLGKFIVGKPVLMNEVEQFELAKAYLEVLPEFNEHLNSWCSRSATTFKTLFNRVVSHGQNIVKNFKRLVKYGTLLSEKSITDKEGFEKAKQSTLDLALGKSCPNFFNYYCL